LLLKLILLPLLHHHLMLVELLNSISVNILIKVRGLGLRSLVGLGLTVLGLLFNPEVLWGFEVIPEN